MKGLIDYEDEEFIRRTTAFCDFLGELQKLLATPRPPDAATVQKKAQDESVTPISGTAGDGHPFGEEL